MMHGVKMLNFWFISDCFYEKICEILNFMKKYAILKKEIYVKH